MDYLSGSNEVTKSHTRPGHLRKEEDVVTMATMVGMMHFEHRSHKSKNGDVPEKPDQVTKLFLPQCRRHTALRPPYFNLAHTTYLGLQTSRTLREKFVLIKPISLMKLVAAALGNIHSH